MSSGINVSWTVTDASGTEYALSGNWQYSNSANTSSRWSGSGSNFSNDDGIWGAASGNLNGNSSGPQLQNVSDGWGHENPNSGDSQCSDYYMNGTQSSSSSIRNYMFYR